MRKHFINGNIMTMVEGKRAEAFTVEGDRFLKVGTTNEILKDRQGNDEIVDLNGQWVLPGFNDSHMHLINYGLSKRKVDLSHCRSLQELEETLKAQASTEGGYFGDWIVGHGWNEESFNEPTLPTADFLDKISQDYPIFLSRACYHVAALNSKGLERAGIHSQTLNPEGGKIDRDRNGTRPTGILRENAIYMAYSKIPAIDQAGQLKSIIQSAQEDALKYGLTSIQTDDFAQAANHDLVVLAYQELEREGKLKIRINLQMLAPTKEALMELIRQGIYTGKGSSMLKFGPIKILADGSLGGRTAALLEPYEGDPENRGMLIYETQTLKEMIALALQNRLQPAVHAIGDGAMDQLLKVYDSLTHLSIKRMRPRLIHCQIINHDIIKRMKDLGVVADIQPGFLTTDLKMIESRIGKKRAKESYGWKSMLNQGVRVAGGSDCPIEPMNPFWGVFGAVARTDHEGKPKGGWYPDEALTLEEAIGLYTIGASYCTFEEEMKGKIAPGYLADFILVGKQDLSTATVTQLRNTVVNQTYVGGICQYQRTGAC